MFVPLLLASTLTLQVAAAGPASTTQSRPVQKVVVYDFTVGHAAQNTGPSDSVCDNNTLTPETTDFLANDVDLPASVTRDVIKKLPTTYQSVAPSDKLDDGTLVLSGCLISADPGNATKRLIGMGMGSSRLAAHVILSRQASSGIVSTRTFDVAVKGSNPLPPLGPAGLAVHAVRERRQTMDALEQKLAGQVIKNLRKKDNGPEV